MDYWKELSHAINSSTLEAEAKGIECLRSTRFRKWVSVESRMSKDILCQIFPSLYFLTLYICLYHCQDILSSWLSTETYICLWHLSSEIKGSLYLECIWNLPRSSSLSPCNQLWFQLSILLPELPKHLRLQPFAPRTCFYGVYVNIEISWLFSVSWNLEHCGECSCYLIFFSFMRRDFL